MTTELICSACNHRWTIARKIPVEEQIVCPNCGNGPPKFERKSTVISSEEPNGTLPKM